MNLTASERLAVISAMLVVVVTLLTWGLLASFATITVASAVGLGIIFGLILPRAVEVKT